MTLGDERLLTLVARSVAISTAQHVRVLQTWPGSQPSFSWAAFLVTSTLGFPDVGGVITGGIACYVRIRQQPTALQGNS
jgi:hypothetical protein